MSELAYQSQKFIAFHVYDARYITRDGEQDILLEIRTKFDRVSELFTVINDEEVHSSSIQALLLMRADCEFIVISHQLPVKWNGESRKATLIEVFGKQQLNSSQTYIKLKLTVDDKIYTTAECDSFTEAVSELHEHIGSSTFWRFQTCFDCKFSRPAFMDPIDDRNELRCYRDVPKAFQEVQQKSKFASQEDIFSGEYFVNSFHRCAAWQTND